MATSCDYWLVLLSVIVAIIAIYVALDLASRVAAPHRSRSGCWLWLAGGALAMGTGIAEAPAVRHLKTRNRRRVPI